jgi:hypothetical protein
VSTNANDPARDDILRAIEAEAIAAIERESAAAGVAGQITALEGLLSWIGRARVATTSTLRRSILAEVRDEITSRLVALRDD